MGRIWAGAVIALAVACGPVRGTESIPPPNQRPTNPPPACVPTTCAAQHANCGIISDGCGHTLSCGECNVIGGSCGGGGVANVCGVGTCTPKTCAQFGKNCGDVSDGCGGVLQCGTCSGGQTCGGGGVANVCGGATACTPATCASLGKNCGTTSDGCGGVLDCGGCASGQSCGASGIANVCATTPTSGGAIVWARTFSAPMKIASDRISHLAAIANNVSALDASGGLVWTSQPTDLNPVDGVVAPAGELYVRGFDNTTPPTGPKNVVVRYAADGSSATPVMNGGDMRAPTSVTASASGDWG